MSDTETDSFYTEILALISEETNFDNEANPVHILKCLHNQKSSQTPTNLEI